MYKTKPKAPAQWKQAEDDRIPFVVILAPAEHAAGTVRIKQQLGKEATEALAGGEGAQAGDAKGEEVKMEDMVKYLKDRL